MAVLVMALGIGANTALFTVVRSVLLKPLPYKDPGRLVSVYERWNDTDTPDNRGGESAASFAIWRRASKSFEQLALLYRWASYNVSAEGGQLPERVPAARCSWNLFSTLGVPPAYGRDFTAEDDKQGANGTVILSWGFWKRRFGGDQSVIGKKISLDAKPYTVIGIMPAWFAYPDTQTQLWASVFHEMPPSITQALDNHQFDVVARLKPGATMAQALDELDAVQKQIKRENPGPAVKSDVTGRPLLDDIVLDYKTPLYVLLAATGCVLLIACLNVANLLVARSAARRKEVAIRAALGGNRWRLIREQVDGEPGAGGHRRNARLCTSLRGHRMAGTRSAGYGARGCNPRGWNGAVVRDGNHACQRRAGRSDSGTQRRRHACIGDAAGVIALT